MYEETKLLFNGPPHAEVVKRHPAGVCSSFTMDWLKKLLANKPVNESTYSDTSRIKKLVKRQVNYEKTGNLEVDTMMAAAKCKATGYDFYQVGLIKK